MAKTLRLKKVKYLVLFLLAFLLFSLSLSQAPVHLNQDELMFALNANSISKTLSDYYGNPIPFYFRHLDSFWATPVIVYLTSIFLKFFSISESTIRLSSAFVGAFGVFLITLLAEKIFKNKNYAFLTGLLLATTPVYFIHSRLLLDNLYTVPFVLVWLYFLKRYLDGKKLSHIFLSTIALGFGIHSYHAAKIMMPIYFLATLTILFYELKKKKKPILVAFSGFLIPILLFLPWLQKHPDTLLNQVSYIGSIDKTVETQKGIWGVFSFKRLGTFITSYPTYFSPEILFTEGDRSLIHSTRTHGAFLFPGLFLLIFGIMEVLYKRKDLFSKLILFGFLTYPIAPSIVNDPQRISRGLVVIPFAVLLFIYGVNFLLKTKKKVSKYLILLLVSLSAIQFLFFVNDYFGEYRKRSYAWFNYDIGGVLESAIRTAKTRDVETVYVDRTIPFATYYSDFYQKKLDINIEDKMSFLDFTKEDITTYGDGTLFVVRYDNAPKSAEREVDGFERIETIREPDGRESFYVFYKDR